MTAYGKKERQNENWFEAHWEKMKPAVETKRTALLAYKVSPSQSTLDAWRSAGNNAKRVARHCANIYWLNLCCGIETAANTGDARDMYEGIKRATGPPITKTAPLKDKTGGVITDKEK